MAKIIGIDPGLAETGVGIIRGKGLKVSGYSFGAISTDKNDPTARRLDKIYSKITAVLKDETPDLMILEDVFSLEKYPKSGIVLGKVSGVVMLAGYQMGIPIREVAVREAKKILTGNGNAGKEQLEKAVRRTLEITAPIRPFHSSDALGLALIGLFRYNDARQLRRIPQGKDKLL